MTRPIGEVGYAVGLRRAIKAACAAYFAFLTLLLLSHDPSRYVPAEGRLLSLLTGLMPWAHLISFAVLALLATSVRWRAPWWAVLAILAAYGGATELAQGLVPGRTPDWLDWLQDLLGLAVGAAACFAAAACWRRVRPACRTTKIQDAQNPGGATLPSAPGKR